MTLLLPDSLQFSLAPPDNVTAVTYDASRPLPTEYLDAAALVVWGSSRSDIASASRRMPHLRWVQTLAAGTDAILSADFPEKVILTSGNGLHNLPVAEHALALILALLRRLPAAARARTERRWAHELGGVQPLRPVNAVTSLIGARGRWSPSRGQCPHQG